MSKLVVRIVHGMPAESTKGASESVDTFYLSRGAWNSLLKIEDRFGFFSRLNTSINLKCGKCNSFSVPARALFYALCPNPCVVMEFKTPSGGLSEEQCYNLYDEIWALLDFMTEEKLTTDKEWEEYEHNVMLEKNLLYDKNGDFLFYEESYPIGLIYNDVFFKLKQSCQSCDNYTA